MIANQETEVEFTAFFKGLVKLADRIGYEFDTEFIMMDSYDTSYNAAKTVFPSAKVLMCWFYVMKNVKKNCQRPLSDEKYEELLIDVKRIHMSKSASDYEAQLVLFKEKWNTKATKGVYTYMSTWFTGRFSKWQIFHTPPGWANTNSNIESFNATIKRDFSLRKRYSVYGSVNVIKQMIIYYSTHKKVFQTTPRFNVNTHNRGKKLSFFEFKKVDRDTVLHRGKWLINKRKHTCNCRFFLKYAICSHILGFMYKNPKVDAEAWFGDKYNNRATDFNFNMKRGAKKKSGRYPNSEKALSKY